MNTPAALGMLGCLTGLLLVLPGATAAAQDRPVGPGFQSRSEARGARAAAATSQPLATLTAIEVLKAGGSAVDAAIAANAMLSLVEPTGCGLGGDLFAILWDAEEGIVGFNGSGRSPRGLTLEMLRGMGLRQIPAHGPLPISVPGCVDGWFALHSRFGRLPMERLLAPTIEAAREGFVLTPVIADAWQRGVQILGRFDDFREQFTLDGQAPVAGQLWRNPGLAFTLEQIAAHGREGFYSGAIAERIVSAVQAEGGFLSLEDLTEHVGEWVTPISTRYRQVTLHELPPNGQGITALQQLNLLAGYDLAKLGFGSAEHLHYFVETKKLAFEDRARLIADPSFFPAPVERLLSEEYAAERRELINPERAAARHAPGLAAFEEGDTIILACADERGQMIALIQSNYRGMGSGIAPAGLGFVLQDRGELFDLEPGRPNSYAPGKRPFHTIIPALLTKDEQPWVAFGVMGGATQPQMHAWITCNLVDFGMGLQAAGDAPRCLHRGSSEPTGERMLDGGRIALESGLADWEQVRALLRRGHKVEWVDGEFGGYQAVGRDLVHGTLQAASEMRKDGLAIAY
jgi:gamma-glutamyltranspeptidase / glutathione hydrolase